MVNINVEVTEYVNRVLTVFKAKRNLKTKEEALNAFIEEYGEEYIEKEVKEEVLKEMINNYEKYKKKYPKRRMTIKELDKLCGISD